MASEAESREATRSGVGSRQAEVCGWRSTVVALWHTVAHKPCQLRGREKGAGALVAEAHCESVERFGVPTGRRASVDSKYDATL
jgi:hypothetical protein